MQLANKSEGTIEAMEKRLTKRNTGPRAKTEFEIMKESKIVMLFSTLRGSYPTVQVIIIKFLSA